MASRTWLLLITLAASLAAPPPTTARPVAAPPPATAPPPTAVGAQLPSAAPVVAVRPVVAAPPGADAMSVVAGVQPIAVTPLRGARRQVAAAPATRPGYRWPLDGAPAVTRPFQPPDTPYGRGHRGVDLAAAPDARVLAAGAGVVAFAGVLAGRGVVSVQHADGLRTTYEPVAPTVAVGASVPAGAPLGTLAAGHAGCPAAACLHWGLRRGDVYLDPLSLLGLAPVRLLPLDAPAGPRRRETDAS